MKTPNELKSELTYRDFYGIKLSLETEISGYKRAEMFDVAKKYSLILRKVNKILKAI